MSERQIDAKCIEKKIEKLLNLFPYEIMYSNCHGTVLYLLDESKQEYPEGVHPINMSSFLEEKCKLTDNPEKYDIVSIWSKHSFRKPNIEYPVIKHSAIFLDPSTETIFHQHNELGDFEITTINEYISQITPNKQFKRGNEIIIQFHKYLL